MQVSRNHAEWAVIFKQPVAAEQTDMDTEFEQVNNLFPITSWYTRATSVTMVTVHNKAGDSCDLKILKKKNCKQKWEWKFTDKFEWNVFYVLKWTETVKFFCRTGANWVGLKQSNRWQQCVEFSWMILIISKLLQCTGWSSGPFFSPVNKVKRFAEKNFILKRNMYSVSLKDLS